MYTNNKLSKAVRLAIAFGAASATAFTASVNAAEEDETAKVERIEVTGSRIKRTDLETSSPIQITSAEEIKLSGFTRIEDLMNSLPQVEAAETSFLANGSAGTATLDLRGMGANRTLVLVNGRRLQPGGIYTQAADVNQIPAALVKRVEVLTGGGSATYGADAVAGVVNFVMNDDFEGFELTVGGSGYQHNNDNKYMQERMDARGFDYPTGNTGIDGKAINIDLTMGGEFAGGKGHATAYATWRQVDELRQGARDYSSCALNAAGTACGGSGTTPNPNFYFYPVTDGETDFSQEVFWTLGTDSSFIPSVGNVYNFAPVNHFMRPDERYTFGAFVDYEINEHARPYMELGYMHDRTVAQIAESGIFFRYFNFDINNPLFSDAQRAQFRNEFGADVETIGAYIGKRNKEGGGRQDNLEHSSYRIVAGVEGDINDSWSYDASFQYGSTASNSVYRNDFYAPRIDSAVGAIGSNPCTGVCQPYPVFTYNGISPEVAATLGGTGILTGLTSQTIVNAFVTGELDFTLPSASMPLAAVFGVENREVDFERLADEVFALGDLAGQGGPTPSLIGGYSLREIFGELSVPLVDDAPAMESLILDLGARYSDYNTSGGETTYKVALDWTPVADWKVRASYNRAVRAPNVAELFASQSIGLWQGEDPCAGATPEYSAAQCANTGVPADLYGTIAPNPADQYNGFFGGNPNLKPEIADTISFGVVANPFEGFNFSVDYWDIQLEEVIGTIGAELTVRQCAETGLAAFCNNITRAPGTASLWRGEAGFVAATNINLASRHWRGVDVSSNYETDIGDGKLTVKLIGTYSLKKEYEPLPGVASATYDCAGMFNANCFAQPDWRHSMTVSYTTGDFWTASAKWRFFGAVDHDGTTDQLVGDGLSSESYLDLTGAFDINDHVSLLVGVNNVLDREPPIVGGSLGSNGNTVAGFYDTLGRYIHASVTMRF
ncbi:TonB-dependent receptor domain-containing protein [Rheinheimera maricola]|uniref:TonB-dependent receptor n=1 Tax=Rheinheimera maricola TaxID=2793282 RepID=A0ABS7XDG3_9GAMM|nr:TonB-dependent receptor [Rheinheimera maricola]MBZ9612807.1 TonB-dependent receptor [Rheinheimera maricola]